MRQCLLPARKRVDSTRDDAQEAEMIRTDFHSREDDFVLAIPANAHDGCEFEKVDAFEEGAARLEESPEV